jgi:hypothetical protein
MLSGIPRATGTLFFLIGATGDFARLTSALGATMADDGLFQQAVREHAVYLGMDPVVDAAYLWYVASLLTNALPVMVFVICKKQDRGRGTSGPTT